MFVWEPDTCPGATQGQGCRIKYEGRQTPIGYRGYERACSAHRLIAGSVTHHAVVHEENIRKNTAFNEAEKLEPLLLPEDMLWSFDPSRHLTVDFQGKLNADGRLALQLQLDTISGAGRATVV